jgi:hypothetical protein
VGTAVNGWKKWKTLPEPPGRTVAPTPDAYSQPEQL